MSKNTCTTTYYPCTREECDGTHLFSMFSLAGEKACIALIDAIRGEIEAGLPRKALAARFRRGMAVIEKKHPEVHDTAVREPLANAFDDMCREQGWALYGQVDGDYL